MFVDDVALATAAGSCQILGCCTVLEWCKESNGKKKNARAKITGLRSKRSQNFQYMKHTEKETNIL